MRVPEGFKAVIPLDYEPDTLVQVLSRVIGLAKSLGVRAYLTEGTSVVTVMLRGVKRSIAIPPLTVLVPGELDVAPLARMAHIYYVVESSWVDCKELPKAVRVMSDSDLPLLARASLDVSRCNSVGELLSNRSTCGVLSLDECLDPAEFEDAVLGGRLVASLSSVRGVGGELVEGRLAAYLRNHIITYGVQPVVFKGVVYNVRGLKKTSVLGKPLVFVDSRELVVELPNRSVIFAAKLGPLDYHVLRAVLYVC